MQHMEKNNLGKKHSILLLCKLETQSARSPNIFEQIVGVGMCYSNTHIHTLQIVYISVK